MSRAVAVRRFGMNGAMVQRHNLSADRQAEPGAADAGTRDSRLDELVEDRFAFIVGDSWPVVLDGYIRCVVRAGE